jgi:hypothetical protein
MFKIAFYPAFFPATTAPSVSPPAVPVRAVLLRSVSLLRDCYFFYMPAVICYALPGVVLSLVTSTTPFTFEDDMKSAVKIFAFGALAVLLAGCGGGSAEVAVVQPGPEFIVWPGNAGGVHVIDGLNHSFAFYADTGCLHNFQTGRENTAFCIVRGSNIVAYGPFRGQIANVLAADGSCRAAIIDQLTGNFSDVETDVYGREVVATTSLRPAFCVR